MKKLKKLAKETKKTPRKNLKPKKGELSVAEARKLLKNTKWKEFLHQHNVRCNLRIDGYLFKLRVGKFLGQWSGAIFHKRQIIHYFVIHFDNGHYTPTDREQVQGYLAGFCKSPFSQDFYGNKDITLGKNWWVLRNSGWRSYYTKRNFTHYVLRSYIRYNISRDEAQEIGYDPQ